MRSRAVSSAAVIAVLTALMPLGHGTTARASARDGATPPANTSSPAAANWFPESRDVSLLLDPPPVRTATATSTQSSDLLGIDKEQVVIPVPAGAWTGLTGIVTAAVLGSSRSFRRFIFR